MGNAWFETVAEAQRRAKKRLPPSVYGALIAGSEKGVTLHDNEAAFDELGLAPHVAGLSAKRDLATSVMGQPISFPVIISPRSRASRSKRSSPPTRRRSSRCTG
jgi:isopentenyl diphosphate isomerase/L-lactate dehydrogenase-like FMN-dependent dehydrogenase